MPKKKEKKNKQEKQNKTNLTFQLLLENLWQQYRPYVSDIFTWTFDSEDP